MQDTINAEIAKSFVSRMPRAHTEELDKELAPEKQFLTFKGLALC
jgi:hypothetical protein